MIEPVANVFVETVPGRAADPAQQAVMMPVSGPVEAGDVLVFDSENPGQLRKAASIGDPAVVGVAEADSAGEPMQVPVFLTGLVKCKVDAGYGAIKVGDLLATSPTPGHAMRAISAEPGTILGKAAASVETGTGTIEILVMPR